MERSKGRRPVRAGSFGLLEPRGRHAGPRVVRRLRVRVAYQMGMTGISI